MMLEANGGSLDVLDILVTWTPPYYLTVSYGCTRVKARMKFGLIPRDSAFDVLLIQNLGINIEEYIFR